MQVHYALYDPSHIGPFRNYWSWKSDPISKSQMEIVYYAYLIKNKPEYPNRLTASDLWGGALAVKDWVVIYRYYNGGRDIQGRPERYVILTGWIARGDCDASILQALRAGTFDALAKAMPLPCPVPQSKLEETLTGGVLNLPEKSDLLAQLEREPNYDYAEFNVEGALRDLLALAKLDPEETFHLKLRQQGSAAAMQLVNCQTKPKPEPKEDEEDEAEQELETEKEPAAEKEPETEKEPEAEKKPAAEKETGEVDGKTSDDRGSEEKPRRTRKWWPWWSFFMYVLVFLLFLMAVHSCVRIVAKTIKMSSVPTTGTADLQNANVPQTQFEQDTPAH